MSDEVKSNKPWLAELSIREDEVLFLLQTQFSAFAGLHLLQVKSLGAGWDNTVFLVPDDDGKNWVFRFPRRPIAVALLENEIRALPKLSTQLSMPIPTPYFLGQPSETFPWPFAGYSFLVGKSACSFRLSDDERMALAPDLARFLRTLHSLSPADFSMGKDEHARLSGEKHAEALGDRWQKVQLLLDDEVNRTSLTRLLTRSSLLPEAKDDRVVHGDLYARHLLLKSSSTKPAACSRKNASDDDNGPQKARSPFYLSGIIDWGDLHIGDAAVDLSLVFGFLPPQASTSFFRLYGEIDDDTKTLARFRALISALAQLEYAADVQDADLLFEGKKALRHLGDVLC